MKTWLSLLLLLVGTSGCTTSVTVSGTVPTPLVAKLPARVGVYYSPEFRTFQHEETIDQQGSYKVDFSDQNLTFFRNLMNAMFETVVEVEEPPLSEEQMSTLDGVVKPSIIKYGFLTPAISGLNFYSASIHYRIELFDADGSVIGDWTLVGYGKAEGSTFSGEEALEEATLLAIRDGGARIAIDLPGEPPVAEWIARQRGRASQQDPSQSGGE